MGVLKQHLGLRFAQVITVVVVAFAALLLSSQDAQAHDIRYCGTGHTLGYYRDYYVGSYSRYFGGDTYFIYRTYRHWSNYGLWYQYTSSRYCGSYELTRA